jgi:hypothetical protein
MWFVHRQRENSHRCASIGIRRPAGALAKAVDPLELKAWLQVIEREGDVQGLAGLDQS